MIFTNNGEMIELYVMRDTKEEALIVRKEDEKFIREKFNKYSHYNKFFKDKIIVGDKLTIRYFGYNEIPKLLSIRNSHKISSFEEHFKEIIKN